MAETLLDFTKICRCCLNTTTNDEQMVFLDESSSDDEVPLSNMITTCTVTKFHQNDKLPHQICIPCVKNIKISFSFKKTCEQSYQKLLKLITPSEQEFENSLNKSIQTEEITFHCCERCELKFMNEESLKEHRFQHKGSDYKCRCCGKVYTRLNHLKRHIIICHPEVAGAKSSMPTNECTICNKQFMRAEHLTRHMQTHSNKSIECLTIDGEGGGENSIDQDDSAEIEYLDDELDNHLNDERDEEKSEFNEFKIKEDFKQENEVDGEPVPEELMAEPDIGMLGQIEYKTEPNDDFSLTEDDYYPDNQDDDDDDDDDGGGDGDDDDDKEGNSDDEEFSPNTSKRSRGRPKKTGKSPKKIKTEKVVVPCEVCKINFDSQFQLTRHMQKDHGIVTSKIHTCKKCDKTFTRSTHLRRHEVTHLEIKPFKCELCEKRFTRADHLSLHMHHHSNEKPHICDVCQKGFTRMEHLRKHKESRHGDKPSPAKTEFCTICNKGFTTAKYLQVHMRVHSERSFICKFCQQTYETKAELTEHLKTHVNERPFLCSECGLRFVRNDYLVIHMRRHKGEKPYKCKFCGKGFPRATDLTVHERYHTGEKTHLCTICGKGFQRAYNLLVHTRVHTGERPYQCPHCSKSFAQGNDLKAHVRRHTGERYKCEICGDGFIQGYHLTQHKRTQHGIDMKSHIRRVEKFITPTAQLEQKIMLQQQQVMGHLPEDEISPHHQNILSTPSDHPIIKVEPQMATQMRHQMEDDKSNIMDQSINILHQQHAMHSNHQIDDHNNVGSNMPISIIPHSLFTNINPKQKLPHNF